MVYDGGGMIRQPSPGIHWFGPGGSGVYYPQPRPPIGPIGGPVHLPEQPLGGLGGVPIHFPFGPFGGGPFHGIPNPGIQPHFGPGGLAHIAARRAGRRAIALRRALY